MATAADAEKGGEVPTIPDTAAEADDVFKIDHVDDVPKAATASAEPQASAAKVMNLNKWKRSVAQVDSNLAIHVCHHQNITWTMHSAELVQMTRHL